eukprot:Phypoly_transcript_01502.p1 GENE.Phypoly_transcript_01502~~Phypoly_transcript_01502.p1  ORF type:complete len:1033 (+),score=184.98 Phypoly_transcript_01502:1-3099(+)
MMRHRKITLERLEKFVSDTYFKDVNIRGKIFPTVSKESVTLQVFHAPGRISYNDALKGEYVPAKVGDSFGPSWSTHWFKVSITVPSGAEWVGKEVVLSFNGGCEAMIWDKGVPMQGLTGGTWVDKRTEYTLLNSAKGGEHFDFMIELACNGMFGTGRDGLINAPDMDKTYTLSQAEIAVFDREAYAIMLDITTLWEITKTLPEESTRAEQALYVANRIINVCNTEDRSTWAEARKIAKEFFNQKNGASQHNVSAIGHCHIDVAWLWPYAETRRKSGRSFSTQIRYMDEYPEYKFTQSQAQLYEWVKVDYPELYQKMKDKIKTGQFVPTGGTWVEMDGNIPSGESFIRQFLFGQRLFQKEFGITCTEFWLPDTFGYSAQLPQVVKHSGIDYFMTQKLSWNNINKFPHSTFIWEGIDGSQVLTHFPPACTYNSSVGIEDVYNSAKSCKDKDRCNESLLVYGHGDGGGGPTIEMLERLRRLTDVDGLPRVQNRSPYEFFTRCEPSRDELLTWVGELYFELHRGTYTSQARTKKGNRRSEFLLHDAEFLAVLAQKSKSTQYPEAINEMWKLVLLNQFHDVLPGSSIGMVYTDAEQYYDTVSATANKLIADSLAALAQGEPKKEGGVSVVNTTSFDRREVVDLPAGVTSPQVSHSGKPLGIVHAPAYGSAQLSATDIAAGPAHAATLRDGPAGSFLLENQFVRVSVTSDGTIDSIFDKRAQREVVEKGKRANKFVLYDDIPLFWDAWDIEIYSLEKMYQLGKGKVKALENGPLRVSVEVTYADLTKVSTLTQVISLTAVSPRIDFDTTVDWHEAHKFLKVEFPTTIRSPVATYEIQFGHIQRPTHFNTSWDMARFEVCGHKWGDLSEHGFGLTLLNDSKYGYATHLNVMRLSLLRAPKAPDDQCDMGKQTFRYSLLPHAGTLQDAGVIAQGYAVNAPLHVVPSQALPFSGQSIFSTTHPAVVIETIKKAEDTDAWIVRVYESFGGTAHFSLKSVLPVKSISSCNGLEADIAQLAWREGLSEAIVLTPFKVASFKIHF